MHAGMLSSRAGSVTPGPSPAPSTLPPFLLGGPAQSPPARSSFGGGLGQAGLAGSAYKHPVSHRKQSPGSPKSNRKDVPNMAPPVDGLFDASASAYPLHAPDAVGLGGRAADAGLGASPMIFSDQPSGFQKFGHHLANPNQYVSGMSPGLAPVTPFAGTMGGSQYTATPASHRQQGYPTSRRVDALATTESPPTQYSGDTSGEITEQCWVTVFGFPADSAPYMLQEFAHYGTIVRHSMDVNTNWMHVCYQSPLQARKALSKHGKIILTSIMLGVMPCTDHKAMQLDQALSDQSGSEFGSPVIAGRTPGIFGAPQQQQQQQQQRGGTPSGMRPLTSSFQPQHNAPSGMRDMDPGTPRKADGVVGKAMEYMFGW